MNRIKSTSPVYYRVSAASLGTFIVGFHIAIYNSMMSVITKLNQWDLLNEEEMASNQGIITSMLSIGALIGSLLADKIIILIQSIRRGLIFVDYIGICGILIMISSPQFQFQVIGRFIAGFLAGINTCLVMSYIREFSPTEISGSTGSFNQISIVIGIFISFLCGLALPQHGIELEKHYNNTSWRLILGIPIIIHLIRLLIFSFIYTLDAPSYLKKRQEREKFNIYLQKVYKLEYQEQIQNEYQQTYYQQRNYRSQEDENQQEKLNLDDPIYRKKLILGIIFSISQQVSGINAIMFYSNKIFIQFGMQKSATLITSIIGVIQIIATIFCGYVVDRIGRKSLNQFGFSIIIICLLNLWLSNFAYESSFAVIASVFLHIIGFSISLGPILFIYVSEILNRAGISIIISVNWCFTILIGYFFPILILYLSIGGAFFLFAILSISCFIYLQLCMVETKGKSRIEIDSLFQENQINKGNKTYSIEVEQQI